eukprot:CAMPEP_0172469360 /NCGR_PEP_ID=MMETSP1065-20121228/63567_1 /TAXON_ID=265537 /ORGANISM="Amphiprora paludosa, Strain CCMP125" /LENGTH=324 /DNA_ID=CAMNT_0013227019 /DNA_START=72 /DNA_END=1042 /DNA_ORIENTATION=-
MSYADSPYDSSTPENYGDRASGSASGSDTSPTTGSSSSWEQGETDSHVSYEPLFCLVTWSLWFLLMLAVLLARYRRQRHNQEAVTPIVEDQVDEEVASSSSSLSKTLPSSSPSHGAEYQQHAVTAEEEAVATSQTTSFFRLVALLACFMAWSLSIVTHTTCAFLSVDEDSFSYDDETWKQYETVGLWKVALPRNFDGQGFENNQCLSNFRNTVSVRVWDDNNNNDDYTETSVTIMEPSPALITARVGGIVSSTVGGIVMVILFLSCLVPRWVRLVNTKLTTNLLVVAMMGQCLTLVLLALPETCDSNTDSCHWDRGALMAATAS